MRASLTAAALTAALLLVTPAAAPAATCKVPRYPNADGGFRKLTVQRTGCERGRRVARAYIRCLRSGEPSPTPVFPPSAGYTCERPVRGFACTEKRTNPSPVEFAGRVRCRLGVKRVTFRFYEVTGIID